MCYSFPLIQAQKTRNYVDREKIESNNFLSEIKKMKMDMGHLGKIEKVFPA